MELFWYSTKLEARIFFPILIEIVGKWIFPTVVGGNAVAVVSTLLWVAVAFHVGLQNSEGTMY